MASSSFTTYLLYYFMQKNAKNQSEIVFWLKAAIASAVIALCVAIAVHFPIVTLGSLAAFMTLVFLAWDE